MCNFHLALPVTGVDSLHEFLESGKGRGLLVVDHFVRDLFGKAIVCLLVVFPWLDLARLRLEESQLRLNSDL